jgi:hypothetical protein
MMPPTIASLKAMARFATAAEALEAAREITHVPEVLPRVIAEGGGMRIVLPGDPGYDGEQVLPDASVDWMSFVDSGLVTGFGAPEAS